jgi:hypothetical protein
VPHPAYDPYHKFVNTHGSKRCDVCDGLEDDQYHATNAQSTTTTPAHPIQGATLEKPTSSADTADVPAAQMPPRGSVGY